jgi:hypothetical protein
VWACRAGLLQNLRAQSGVFTEPWLLQSDRADITKVHSLQFQTEYIQIISYRTIFNIYHTVTDMVFTTQRIQDTRYITKKDVSIC